MSKSSLDAIKDLCLFQVSLVEFPKTFAIYLSLMKQFPTRLCEIIEAPERILRNSIDGSYCDGHG